ncbi:MAG: DUF4097 domain-containing protein [Leptolinea sp.]|nr:DUF4097 domain-containing protein [Leptolinea sp.]
MQQKKVVATILIVIMVILCVLMSIAGLFFVRTGFFPFLSSKGNLFNQSNIVTTIEEHEIITVETPARLVIENPFGNVKLTGTTGNQITIDFVKRVWTNNPDKAQEYLEKTKVIIVQEGQTVKINVIPAENSFGIMVNVDFVISVPVDTVVNISLNNGDINLNHLEAEAILHSDFGDIYVSDLQNGELNATSRNGTVSASQIRIGNLPLLLSSDFGDLQLIESDSGQVDVRSKNGELTLENVKSSGPMSLSSDFGSISFAEGRTGAFNALSRNGDVTLNSVAIGGPLSIETDFGDINLNNAGARSYDLQNKNGTIFVDSPIGPIVANSNFGSIEVINGQLCDLMLTTQNGDIKYTGSIGAGPHSLSTNFGDIFIGLPADSSLDLEAETAFGNIDNAFEITTRGKLQENHLSGKINGGGTSVNVKTSNGTIKLDSIQIKEL